MAEAVELGVVSQGKTIEQAKKNIQEALSLYMEDSPQDQKELNYAPEMLLTTVSVPHA